jgi:pSer/pThr/pTyr-binding forkhead associated (FHA) protein
LNTAKNRTDEGLAVTEDAGDTFIRFETDGRIEQVAIPRRSICGIGRAQTNRVVLDDNSASRAHASIRRNSSGHCILKDLGSTNGTWLNGRAVTAPVGLTSGDVIQIGDHRITFVQTAEGVNAERSGRARRASSSSSSSSSARSCSTYAATPGWPWKWVRRVSPE